MSKSSRYELVFLGDLYLPNVVISNLPYKQIVVNLESPITRSEQPCRRLGKPNIKCHDNNLETVFGDRIAAVCLANNHMGDYGNKGISDTIQSLESAGTPFFGAGSSIEAALTPTVVEIGSERIGLVGMVCGTTSPSFAADSSAGVAPITEDNVKKAIKSAKELGASLVVVTFHWGAEHVYLPNPRDIKIARLTIDAGADLVIGHHAHRTQTWERYNDKYIFYGLGNCFFPDSYSTEYVDHRTGERTAGSGSMQEYWNRNSLAVRYDVENKEIRVDKIRYEDDRIYVTKSAMVSRGFFHGTGFAYSTAFHLSYCVGKLRRTLFKFIRNPKVPRLKHFRGVLKVLASREHS